MKLNRISALYGTKQVKTRSGLIHSGPPQTKCCTGWQEEWKDDGVGLLSDMDLESTKCRLEYKYRINYNMEGVWLVLWFKYKKHSDWVGQNWIHGRGKWFSKLKAVGGVGKEIPSEGVSLLEEVRCRCILASGFTAHKEFLDRSPQTWKLSAIYPKSHRLFISALLSVLRFPPHFLVGFRFLLPCSVLF